MLTIRNTQIEAIASARKGAFTERVMGQLREYNPEQAGSMDDSDLQVLVSTCLEKAHGHGIVSEWAVTAFCRFALVHGLEFDTTLPDIGLVLKSKRFDGNTKIELLEEAFGYEPLERAED